MANGYYSDRKGNVRNGKGQIVREPASRKRAKKMKANPKATPYKKPDDMPF